MKKHILILAAFSLFAWNAQGQSASFGVKAGANFSNLKVSFDEGSASPDGATSFYAGAFVDLGISEKVHLQPEALYSIEGAKDADVTYLDIPVMFKYYLIEAFNIQAGPQFGILLDAEGGTDGLKTANVGVNFGAAYELPGGFFVDARYNLGLSNIADIENDPGFTEDVSLKTKNFQLGVGYRF